MTEGFRQVPKWAYFSFGAVWRSKPDHMVVVSPLTSYLQVHTHSVVCNFCLEYYMHVHRGQTLTEFLKRFGARPPAMLAEVYFRERMPQPLEALLLQWPSVADYILALDPRECELPAEVLGAQDFVRSLILRKQAKAALTEVTQP